MEAKTYSVAPLCNLNKCESVSESFGISVQDPLDGDSGRVNSSDASAVGGDEVAMVVVKCSEVSKKKRTNKVEMNFAF